jgi:hypothetical protein
VEVIEGLEEDADLHLQQQQQQQQLLLLLPLRQTIFLPLTRESNLSVADGQELCVGDHSPAQLDQWTPVP